MSTTHDPRVEAKLRHMIDALREYADEIEEYNFESANEAAESIGSEDGEGCPICERLSASLSAGVAHTMWFPDDDQQAEMITSVADHARSYADGLEDELNAS